MDTSETYIKMCEKAEEIQEGRPKLVSRYDFYDSNEALIWLPRQDQLQEMVSEYIQEELGILHSEIKQAFLDFAQWLDTQYLPEPFVCVPTNCFETGEQLWLAFYMSENHNKVWDGENWVK